MTLPPFPVDDQTLDLLWGALNPDPAMCERTSVSDLLTLMSQLGGSDAAAVEEVVNGIHHMRDPQYHTNDVIAALVAEVRRLRGMTGADHMKPETLRAERDAARADLAIVEADARAAFAAIMPGWESPDALLAAHDRLAAFAAAVRDARTHGCDRFCAEGGCDWDIAGFVERVDEAIAQLDPRTGADT